MPPEQYIWIPRWREFQHYKPDPERGPKWIKTHTAQLADSRYLDLTDRQRALLHDLRMMFATFRGRLRHDAPMIARHRNTQTRRDDLGSLNRAGLIEVVSRATLELRIAELYSGSRAEVDKSREETPSHPNPVVPTTHSASGGAPTPADSSSFSSDRGVLLHPEAEAELEPDFNGLSRLGDEPARILAAAARRNLEDTPL